MVKMFQHHINIILRSICSIKSDNFQFFVCSSNLLTPLLPSLFRYFSSQLLSIELKTHSRSANLIAWTQCNAMYWITFSFFFLFFDGYSSRLHIVKRMKRETERQGCDNEAEKRIFIWIKKTVISSNTILSLCIAKLENIQFERRENMSISIDFCFVIFFFFVLHAWCDACHRIWLSGGQFFRNRCQCRLHTQTLGVGTYIANIIIHLLCIQRIYREHVLMRKIPIHTRSQWQRRWNQPSGIRQLPVTNGECKKKTPAADVKTHYIPLRPISISERGCALLNYDNLFSRIPYHNRI